jgi:hypothetical protein
MRNGLKTGCVIALLAACLPLIAGEEVQKVQPARARTTESLKPDQSAEPAAKEPAGITSSLKVSAPAVMPAPEIRPVSADAVTSGAITLPPPPPPETKGTWYPDHRDNRDDHRGHGHRGHRHWPHYGPDYWRHGRFHGYWWFSVLPPPVVIPYPYPVYYSTAVPPPPDPWRGYRVCIVYAGSDIVGNNFVSSVQDYLQSHGVTMVSSTDNASLELYVTSMDADPVHPGYGSSVSISYIWFPGNQFLTAQILNVGGEESEVQAASIATYARQLITQYRY